MATKPRKGPSEGPRAFERRVERMLARRGVRGRGWLVALSGGADSVALLRVLVALSPRMGELFALHVHHGLRGKSADADAEFCRTLCKELGVPFRVVRLKLKKGPALAERARAGRYRLLEKERERRGAKWVALAHHADDQAETVLARLARGAPASGLAGIPAVREPFVRPLIEESRASILHYLESLAQDWREDPSNASDAAERNRIRRNIIPVIERELRRPVGEALARVGAESAEIADFIGAEAAKARKKIEKQAAEKRRYSLAALGKLAAPVRRELWRQVLGDLAGARRASARQVDALEELLASGEGQVALPGGAKAGVSARSLIITK
ncbi:MAG: tRNA lysidine(34) synthetase TilS [Chrysiogenetes bacterium]|nr:tRNA lysidine(34) synthetase TilS [Chrysiogenetes bacterium]